MDFADCYNTNLARLEIEDAIEKCSESSLEKTGDHYFIDSNLAEVQEAIDQIHEAQDTHKDQVRYLDPNEYEYFEIIIQLKKRLV